MFKLIPRHSIPRHLILVKTYPLSEHNLPKLEVQLQQSVEFKLSDVFCSHSMLLRRGVSDKSEILDKVNGFSTHRLCCREE